MTAAAAAAEALVHLPTEADTALAGSGITPCVRHPAKCISWMCKLGFSTACAAAAVFSTTQGEDSSAECE